MVGYAAAQDEVRADHEITRSGAQLLAAWEGFIEECSDGYSWDISEYRNEIRVRDQIEVLIGSDRLRAFDDHADFCAQVQSLDDKFKALAHSTWKFPGAKSWWSQVVPRAAGEDFAGYCQQVYGFAVDEVRNY